MFDACIVGSGPGGVFAAYGLRGRRVLMLDAGLQPPPQARSFDANFYDLRQSTPSLDPDVIGDNLDGLQHIFTPSPSLKLKSRANVSSLIGESRSLEAPVVSDSFRAAISLAQGGLANAWGAGVYRFNDRDLAGFPVTADELTPFYDTIAREIGISGSANDDLRGDFGAEVDLQLPVRLSPNVSRVYSKYTAQREQFHAAGHPGWDTRASPFSPRRTRAARRTPTGISSSSRRAIPPSTIRYSHCAK